MSTKFGVSPREFEELKANVKKAWGQNDIYSAIAKFVDRTLLDADSLEKKMRCAVMFGELYGAYRVVGHGADEFLSALDEAATHHYEVEV
ncbi:hypothetical protein HZC00_01500 [Candidatus Kaiserbacteria bacterium]|nr:hypothetical protein [Candidatus Kaiserbacteria bacterium]